MPPSNVRRHRRWRFLGSALLLTLAACGTFSTGTTEFRPDGTVAFKCQTSLPRCLERADDACHGARYDVVSAADNHAYYGPSSVALQSEVRTSEAVIRCGQRGWSLFGGAPKDTAAPAGPTADAGPPPAQRACVPGVTQTCVGPGACPGGQSCVADGTGFGPCACAPQAADAGSFGPP